MIAIAFALGASVLWGLADYFGGLKSRTYPAAVVVATMYLSSLTVMLLFVGARGEGPPRSSAVLAALAAGLVGIGALSAFYRALAIGTMNIVAPIAASGVCIPVLVGLIAGDRPGVARSVGLTLAIVGVLLVLREYDGGADDSSHQRLSILLAIVAGTGFGSQLVLAEIGSSGDVAWALLLSRLSALPLIGALAYLALRGGGRRSHGRGVLVLPAIGLGDLAANACYNHATTIGELSSVAVASSLHPVMTVALAAVLLGERVRWLGVGVVVCGLVLIAAGG